MDAYRPIEAVAVVVQLASFLQKIKLDPVVETRHLSSLDLSCYRLCFIIVTKKKHIYKTSVVFKKEITLSEPAKMCSKPLESILLLLREYRPNHIIFRS